MKPKLEKLVSGNFDMFCSYEMLTGIDLNQPQLDTKITTRILATGIHSLLKDINPKYRQMIHLNAKMRTLKRTAVLYAHGDSINNKWYYTDGHHHFLVQGWVNRHNKNYALLILECCNPGYHEIHSRHSAVLSPNNTFSFIRKDFGLVQVELYIPEIGYIDDYTIDYEIKRIRSNLTKRFLAP